MLCRIEKKNPVSNLAISLKSKEMKNKQTRFNQYRIMWVMVFFDLPTETKKDRKAASKFRNSLLQDGFHMFQFSFYMRPCSSRENANVHINRVKSILPKHGQVGILSVTDRQFGMMELFWGQKEVEPQKGAYQQSLF